MTIVYVVVTFNRDEPMDPDVQVFSTYDKADAALTKAKETEDWADYGWRLEEVEVDEDDATIVGVN